MSPASRRSGPPGPAAPATPGPARLDAVQPFGFLLVLSPEWVVERVSENSPDWFGQAPAQLLGRPVDEVLGGEALERLRGRLSQQGSDPIERLFDLRIPGDGPPLDLTARRSGRRIVIEGEPAQPAALASADACLRTMIARLKATEGVQDLLEEAARLLQELTGHDRVALCRLAGDGAEAVAETLRGDLESLRGRRVAEVSAERTGVALVADAEARSVPLLPPSGAAGEAPDLSACVLRSPSPACLEQLSDSSLRACLSVPVTLGDRRWGLFACHHGAPLVVPLATRAAAELFVQVFALLLEARQREAAATCEARAQSLHRELTTAIASGATTAQSIAPYFDELRQVLGCDGVAVWLDQEATLSGTTPSVEAFHALVEFLRHSAAGELYATEELARDYAGAGALLPDVAGLLAVPLSRTPGDYLVCFRKESLAGRSEPWGAIARRFAEALRVSVLEVILRLTEAATRDRERAQQKQELLMTELNHRVRNILALMRAIVGQSRFGADSVEDFADVLGDRIQALARAHDQITLDHWGPAPLRGLIEAETSAYLARRAERVRLAGPDLLIQPQAFSTLALVFHELVTNAAKHGALSAPVGAVVVDWRLDEKADLVIEWREQGGPPVAAPERRGFGSIIIERSVPYDLQGQAELWFAREGLTARFSIPSHHIVSAPAPGTAVASEVEGEAGATTGRALIVEDNMIVAMEAEDLLRSLGFAAAYSVPTVAAALERIASERPDFALLDINLGRETSFPVADRLAELDIPFAFASGYGDQAVVPAPHGERPRLSKPFNRRSVRSVLERARPLGGPGDGVAAE